MQQYTLPGVLVDDEMNIIQFIGNTSKYIQPASGAASFNLFKMCKEGLLLDLRTLIKNAKLQQTSVIKNGISIKNNREFININLFVNPIFHPSNSKPYNFLVLFQDNLIENDQSVAGRTLNKAKNKKSASLNGENRIKTLEEELTATKEYLQSLVNEKDAANEELRSTLEELQSSNEELQSTNEEMETAKEELQSTNEELTTVNEELENQNYELTLSNNDLINLLSSVNTPIVMLDNNFRIRRFTPAAEKILNLIPTDIGRMFNDIRPNIKVNNFHSLINEVMDSLESKEVEIQDLKDSWYLLRIKPYKTIENKIDGAVLILTDVDKIKSDSEKLRILKEYSEAIIETIKDPMIILDSGLKIKSANKSFYKKFNTIKQETDNKYIYDLGNGQWNETELKKILNEVLTENKSFEDYSIEYDFQDIGKKTMKLNARKINKIIGLPELILLAMELEN